MNCDLAHERIVTAAYGELPDDELHELERHISACPACRAEREQVLALKVLAGAFPVEEPEANLIARARLRLDEALEAIPPRRWYERLGQRMRNGFASLQGAPVAAMLLLAVGVAGGVGGARWAQRHRAAPASTVAVAQAPEAVVSGAQGSDTVPAMDSVTGISGITRHPNSEIVDVNYSQVVPRHVQGSLDDPQIRQLLMLASKNSPSTQVRDDSVSLLAAECKAGHSCKPAGIRDALMAALLYDKNARVREKALEGLEPYVAEDMRVRNAILQALLTDSDAKIRTESISLLEPVEADTSVRQVLYSVSTTDDSPQIRNVSRQILSQVPEIQ